MEYTEAALTILKKTDEPLSATEIWKNIKELNLIDAKNAKTPEKTLNSYLHINSDSNVENESPLFSVTSKKPDKFILIDKLDLWTEKQNNIKKKLYISNEVSYQVVKDIYTKSKAFNKSATDFRILCYNEKWRKMMNTWRKKTIYDRLRSIEEIYTLLNSYNGISLVEKRLKGEVNTPFWFIEEMQNQYSKEYWENKNSKTLEPANGSGNFIAVKVRRWMYGFKHPDGWETKGLSDIILDEEERYNWIMEEMIHAVEYQPKNMFIYREIFDPEHKLKLKCYTGSYLSDEFNEKMEEWKIEESDLMSNPPYQKLDGGAKASAGPIYNEFIEKGLKFSKTMLFVTPSRWFAGGKGLDGFRKMMMNRTDIKFIKHFNNASDIFGPSVEIKGGVSYFFIDKSYSGKTNFNGELIDLNKFDILVNKTEAFSLITKLMKYENLSKISNPRSFFNISTNDKKLVDTKVDDNYIKCYVSKQKGFEKWININDIKNSNKLNYYRVATPRAATKGGEGLGNLFILNNNECFSDSYMAFFVNTVEEAESLLSYLKTRFCNYIISLRKISQTVKINTFDWVPLVPFDRIWTDEQLYKYFKLDDEIIKLIEN